MGITMKEMLEADFFKGFKLLAGGKGLDKQIQGVAILDAPDGFNWTKGREFVITSGYVFEKNPGLLEKYLETSKVLEISGIGIKLERFLNKIPEETLEIFNDLAIPLIGIPAEPSWMDIINQLNVLVMNKNMKQFRIGNIGKSGLSNINYQTRKINRILSQIESEMDFPAMVYDLSKEKVYYSSHRFIRILDDIDLEINDLWSPSVDVKKEVLCDNLKMVRYRIFDDKFDKPYSWIKIPITVADKTIAYFTVLEATGIIDYFDQFAIRIGFLLIQSLYEQIIVVKKIGDAGFEKLILDIIMGLVSEKDLVRRALELEIDINNEYYLLLLETNNKSRTSINERKELREIVYGHMSGLDPKIAKYDDNELIILIKTKGDFSEKEYIEKIKSLSIGLKEKLAKKLKMKDIVFGFSDYKEKLFALKDNFHRCKQAIKVGRIIYPNEFFLKYSDLGVMAWIDIKESEVDKISKDIAGLKNSPNYEDLLCTLRAYLECKMNYSLTAKKMYIHINTVRKRIEEINDIIGINLEDPTNRLKLELLLKFI